jgi:Uma2 family endonuclease
MTTAPVLPAADPILRPISLKLPTPLGDAELLWLSAHNEGLHFEQTATGVLVLSPPTGGRGNRGEIELVTQLDNWNKRTNFGVVLGISGGVLLPKGGQYEPDTAPISRAAWDAVPIERRDDGFVPVLPTAVFELLSPANLSTTGYTKEFTLKLEDYKRSEVPLVVLLHPKTKHAVIGRPGRADETFVAKVLAFPELPGLELDVAAIYAAVNTP